MRLSWKVNVLMESLTGITGAFVDKCGWVYFTEWNGIISQNFEGIKYGMEWQSRGVFVCHISNFTGLYTSCVPRISMNEQ